MTVAGWMRLAGLTALAAGCCATSEGDYVEAVRIHVVDHPERACCYQRERPASPECLAGVARCGFVKGARVVSSKVSRFGHDSGAMVDVELSGPAGRGSCSMQVLNYPSGQLTIDGGNCSAH